MAKSKKEEKLITCPQCGFDWSSQEISEQHCSICDSPNEPADISESIEDDEEGDEYDDSGYNDDL